MDQIVATAIAGAVPTLAIIAAFVRNETALANVNARIAALTRDVNARLETLTRDTKARLETLTRRIDAVDSDLREWAKITMQQNTDIARLKDKIGLADQK